MMGRPAEEGVLSGSGRLYYDGELVFCTEKVIVSTSEIERDQEEGAFFTLEYIQGDGITGTFPPKNVGHRILFKAGNNKSWEFEFRHERFWYEMPLGPSRPNITGLMGYIVTVSDGLVGSGESMKGPGWWVVG